MCCDPVGGGAGLASEMPLNSLRMSPQAWPVHCCAVLGSDWLGEHRFNPTNSRQAPTVLRERQVNHSPSPGIPWGQWRKQVTTGGRSSWGFRKRERGELGQDEGQEGTVKGRREGPNSQEGPIYRRGPSFRG